MIIYTIILLPISARQNIPNLCVDCKFYKKDFFTFSEFGKCTVFPAENYDEYFLVNGNNNYNNKEYHYCSTARKFDHLCGKEGKFYEKKYKNKK